MFCLFWKLIFAELLGVTESSDIHKLILIDLCRINQRYANLLKQCDFFEVNDLSGRQIMEM